MEELTATISPMQTRDKRLSISYLCGIFDGEGSVNPNISKYDGAGSYASMSAYITNTDLVLLEKIQASYGGGIRKLKTLPGRKQLYRLEWWGAKADDLFRQMRDTGDLITKARRVDLAIQFRELKPNAGKGSGCRKYPVELRDQLLRIAEEIKFLNKRGELAVAETKPSAPEFGELIVHAA
jgi:hypothetical protein